MKSKFYSKVIYLHHIRINLRCDDYTVFSQICEQLKFPIFRCYKDYLNIKIELNVKYETPLDSRYDLFKKPGKYFLIASWEKNVSVKIDAASNTIQACLLWPCVLPKETILHLVILEPLRYILKHHNLLFIHAAVLAKDGKGLMICGAPNAGKSTLAALLNNKGYKFLSDEFALLKGKQIYSLPLKIKLDRRSVEHLKQQGFSVYYPRNIIEKCSHDLTLIIGTGYERLSAPVLYPLNKTKALASLLLDKVNTTIYEKDAILRRRQIQALAGIASQTKCYYLDYYLKHLPQIPGIINRIF